MVITKIGVILTPKINRLLLAARISTAFSVWSTFFPVIQTNGIQRQGLKIDSFLIGRSVSSKGELKQKY